MATKSSFNTVAPHSNNNSDTESDTEKNCQDSKLCKLLKYGYVIIVFVIGFGLVALKLISSDFDDWLDEMQQDVLEFFLHHSMIYIILVVLFITLGKGLGIKDVLSLRTIAVVILAYKIIQNSKFFTFWISVFILGILSSISKLLEYRAIGKELQVVQGTPVRIIFKYIRKILLFCITDEAKIEWVDPKYTFAISEQTRDDRNMDIYSNFHMIVTRCGNKENTDDIDEQNQGRHVDGMENDSQVSRNLSTFKTGVCNVTVFIIAVIWASVIEWVQPITELFLYAHNWTLSARNVIIIVLSEMVDFDKMVEVILIIDALYESGDIIAGKIKGIAFKPAFWALGYLIVMPLTLLWAYSYYETYLNVDRNINRTSLRIGDDNELVPPLDRTSTPLLMDNDDNGFPDVAGDDKDNDMWKRMKYMHNQRPVKMGQQKDAINLKESTQL